jgi:hypothetical protein
LVVYSLLLHKILENATGLVVEALEFGTEALVDKEGMNSGVGLEYFLGSAVEE